MATANIAKALNAAGYQFLSLRRAVVDTTNPGDEWRTCKPGDVITITAKAAERGGYSNELTPDQIAWYQELSARLRRHWQEHVDHLTYCNGP